MWALLVSDWYLWGWGGVEVSRLSAGGRAVEAGYLPCYHGSYKLSVLCWIRSVSTLPSIHSVYLLQEYLLCHRVVAGTLRDWTTPAAFRLLPFLQLWSYAWTMLFFVMGQASLPTCSFSCVGNHSNKPTVTQALAVVVAAQYPCAFCRR